jgi:hypothetical protein
VRISIKRYKPVHRLMQLTLARGVCPLGTARLFGKNHTNPFLFRHTYGETDDIHQHRLTRPPREMTIH